MTDELKPVRCGCGGEAIILSFENLDNSISVYVSCPKCHTSTVSFCGEQAKSNAIEVWNKAMGERTVKVEDTWKIAGYDEINAWCPECEHRITRGCSYCPTCGVKLEWK